MEPKHNFNQISKSAEGKVEMPFQLIEKKILESIDSSWKDTEQIHMKVIEKLKQEGYSAKDIFHDFYSLLEDLADKGLVERDFIAKKTPPL